MPRRVVAAQGYGVANRALGVQMAVFRNKNQKSEALARIGIFNGLTKTDLGVLAKHADEVVLDKGTMLASEGRVGQQMFYVEQGEVSVRRKGRKLATLTRGDVVGELSLIDGQPAVADVRCETDVIALVMSVQDFQTVMNESPNFVQKLLKAVVIRLREADKALAG